MIHCAECGLPFETRRSLHAHIKIHGMRLADYYVKNFPKEDLFTGEPIPFKDYESYISTDFRNKKNMYKWLCSIPEQERFYYCEESFKKHMSEDRKLTYAPNHLYFLTHPRLPRITLFDRESLSRQFKQYSLTEVFKNELGACPDFNNVPSGLLVMQDTREQQPLIFPNAQSVEHKLDFGDYTLAGSDYNYVYVDRKAESDFKGTMVAGFDRFCRELQRAREFGSYLFIVTESDFHQIYVNNCAPFSKKVNLTYVWENMRKIISEYSDVCQFIFTGSRENSSLIIPWILKNGNSLKNIDLQFYLEELKCLG